MLAKIKRFLAAPMLVFVIVASMSTPALAATKPSIRYTESSYSRPSYSVAYGRNIPWNFYLRCGSYKYRYGYRARADIDIFKNSNGKWITGWFGNFTGNKYWTLRTPINSKYKRGHWYVMRYRTNYRSSAYTSSWRATSSRYIDFRPR